MKIDSNSCKPRDDDYCLQESEGWGSAYTCSLSTRYCDNYGKDMRRCCPDSCGTGVFTESDCNDFDGGGKCIYPNGAQCSEGAKIFISYRHSYKYKHKYFINSNSYF